METTELYYPQIAARAGPYTFNEGIEIEVYSAKSSYFDWAKIRFTGQFRPEITLNKKDPAAIQLGYDGALDDVFTGYVAKPYDGGAFANEVNLKDEMLVLEETIINDTFLDTTPQEMLAFFLAKAGALQDEALVQDIPTAKDAPHPAAERRPGDQRRQRGVGPKGSVLLLWRGLLLG